MLFSGGIIALVSEPSHSRIVSSAQRKGTQSRSCQRRRMTTTAYRTALLNRCTDITIGVYDLSSAVRPLLDSAITTHTHTQLTSTTLITL